jgi:hypothetical protein
MVLVVRLHGGQTPHQFNMHRKETRARHYSNLFQTERREPHGEQRKTGIPKEKTQNRVGWREAGQQYDK